MGLTVTGWVCCADRLAVGGTDPVTDRRNSLKMNEARMEPLASLISNVFLTDGGGCIAEQCIPVLVTQVRVGLL